jgi:hypothetical protein
VTFEELIEGVKAIRIRISLKLRRTLKVFRRLGRAYISLRRCIRRAVTAVDL